MKGFVVKTMNLDDTVVRYVIDGDIVVMYWTSMATEEILTNYFYYTEYDESLEVLIKAYKEQIDPMDIKKFSYVMGAELYSMLIDVDGIERIEHTDGLTTITCQSMLVRSSLLERLRSLDPVYRVTAATLEVYIVMAK
jgi:hypothetical protein